MARDISHRSAFESHGETYVRVLAQQGDDIGREAAAWLAASAKRDAREEETLSIARQARADAKLANIIAIIAAIIAIVAIVITKLK